MGASDQVDSRDILPANSKQKKQASGIWNRVIASISHKLNSIRAVSKLTKIVPGKPFENSACLVDLLAQIDPNAQPWIYPVDMVEHCTRAARVLVSAGAGAAGVSQHDAEMLLLRYERGILHGMYGFLEVAPHSVLLSSDLQRLAADASKVGERHGLLIKAHWSERNAAGGAP